VALALASSVNRYIATDQEYVSKLLMENLETNGFVAVNSHHRRDLPTRKKHERKPHQVSSSTQLPRTRGKHAPTDNGNDIPAAPANITFAALDWELDAPKMLKSSVSQIKTRSKAKEHRHAIEQDSRAGVEDEENDLGFDLLISCDCIYNEALIPPFVQTCVDICRLRPAYDPSTCVSLPPSETTNPPQQSNRATIVLIAQQQRSPEVFEMWLREVLRDFHVWRLKDEVLGKGLMAGTGYVVHAMVLRRQIEQKIDYM
jgi:hypothetical protein